MFLAVHQILESLIINNSLAVNESISSVSQNITASSLTQNVTNFASDTDPNWFYSSSAQCASAIVGLMGAFLVTKLINQKSFMSQLKKEIDETKIKINSINAEIQSKKEYIQKIDDEEFVKEFLSDIMNVI